MQSCLPKHNCDYISLIDENDSYLRRSIITNLKIDSNLIDVFLFANSFDSNEAIIEYLNKKNNLKQSHIYYIVPSIKNIKSTFLIDKNNSAILNTSLPIYDIEQDKICLATQVSSYFAGNWKGTEEYFFIFEKLKKENKIKYCNHIRSLKYYNVGPPTYLPDLMNIDTLDFNNKIRRIDSLSKNNLNKIPDSLKLKMGIKNN